MIDVAFRDRALYFPAMDALVCADLHFGRDATSAVQAPLGERADLVGRLTTLCDRYSPAEVVIGGDVLHSFSGTPGDAAESFDRVVREVESRDTRLVITPGNHDAMLGGLWDGRMTPEYRLGSSHNDDAGGDAGGESDGENRVVVCHGHEAPTKTADTYVVGHDHPTIEIEGQRRPCYLYGPAAYEGADVLMVPASTKLAAGVVINRMRARDFQSPLVTDSAVFRPIVRDEETDETLWFPPLGEFRSML